MKLSSIIQPEELVILLGKYEVTKDTHVIVYDNKNGSNAAARFWWMIKSICHEKAQGCHTLLAIDNAGLEIPKLYVGSWSGNNKKMILI